MYKILIENNYNEIPINLDHKKKVTKSFNNHLKKQLSYIKKKEED